MAEKLIIVRHAHRRVIDPTEDSPLSEKGLEQAKNFARIMSVQWIGSQGALSILSSPRLRCQQTLTPLAQALSLPVVVDQDLDEHHGGETHAEFSDRIQNFFRRAIDLPVKTVIACTHGDWIPEWANLVGHQEIRPSHLDQVIWAVGEKGLKFIRFSDL